MHIRWNIFKILNSFRRSKGQNKEKPLSSIKSSYNKRLIIICVKGVLLFVNLLLHAHKSSGVTWTSMCDLGLLWSETTTRIFPDNGFDTVMTDMINLLNELAPFFLKYSYEWNNAIINQSFFWRGGSSKYILGKSMC